MAKRVILVDMWKKEFILQFIILYAFSKIKYVQTLKLQHDNCDFSTCDI